jgi:hypothetical protein
MNDDRNFAIIGGAGSSGSTFLAALLNGHPEVFCAPELSLFNKWFIYRKFSQFQKHVRFWLWRGISTEGYLAYPKLLGRGRLDGIARERLLELVEGADNFKNFTQSLSDEYLRVYGKRVFVEKTPSNAYCFAEFAKVFPSGSMIHLVRDGRDVVCSLMRRGWSLFKSASTWVYAVSCGLASRDLTGYTEIRYENLVQDTEYTLRKLCSVLEVSYTKDMISERRQPTSDHTEIHTWSHLPMGPISTASIGRYHQELSPADLAIFYRIKLTGPVADKLGIPPYRAEDLLDILGYLPDPINHKVSLAHRVFLPIGDLVRRNALHILIGDGFRGPLTEIGPASGTKVKTR